MAQYFLRLKTGKKYFTVEQITKCFIFNEILHKDTKLRNKLLHVFLLFYYIWVFGLVYF